ncbi:MAG TPA: hypothetical protein VGR35_04380 [Tepidisphaeraceae bacterium]|nr:hypothetical protein [Tepidisphaeraceae bacterium]
MDPGLIGGIGGSAVGVVGGIVGTYASIRNAHSRRERRYMIRCAIGFWIGITLFLTGLFVLPHPYRWLLWVPYAIALPLSIATMNRAVAHIRAEAAGGGG